MRHRWRISLLLVLLLGSITAGRAEMILVAPAQSRVRVVRQISFITIDPRAGDPQAVAVKYTSLVLLENAADRPVEVVCLVALSDSIQNLQAQATLQSDFFSTYTEPADALMIEAAQAQHARRQTLLKCALPGAIFAGPTAFVAQRLATESGRYEGTVSYRWGIAPQPETASEVKVLEAIYQPALDANKLLGRREFAKLEPETQTALQKAAGRPVIAVKARVMPASAEAGEDTTGIQISFLQNFRYGTDTAVAILPVGFAGQLPELTQTYVSAPRDMTLDAGMDDRRINYALPEPMVLHDMRLQGAVGFGARDRQVYVEAYRNVSPRPDVCLTRLVPMMAPNPLST
jgi:hypothetical protein